MTKGFLRNVGLALTLAIAAAAPVRLFAQGLTGSDPDPGDPNGNAIVSLIPLVTALATL
jgi:hypothetical protein